MLREIIKLVFFLIPIALLSGLKFIIFDNQGLHGCYFDVKIRRKNKKATKVQIRNYLKDCLEKE